MTSNGITLKVFVVDTDEQMRDSVQWVLEGTHVVHADVEERIAFDVRCFESEESFRDAIAVEKPDILFIDNNLPGKGGMALLEELHRQKMHICTIMTASSVTMERAIRSLMLGGYDFLAKPISPVKLRFHVYKAARYVVLTRRAANMAREKKRIRFEFISVLAHELKSPLNALESYVDIIKNKRSGENSEDYGLMLDRMLIRTQGMRKLITDLLDLTSIESGERRRRLEDLDLTAIARAMVEGLKEEAGRNGITITLAPEEPVMFNADADDMEMILRNLISNAVKYNRPDGRIGIVIAPGDGSVVLEVTDNGIGISEEEQSLLFREFSRIKNEETASIAGSGLGLSIVKKIVALYDGEISVESEKGKGTSFRILLKGKE